MANLHEVKEHIGSVNNTKKITRAMYLISASKSQKAKSQLADTLPYFQHIILTMREILASPDEISTPFIRHDNQRKETQHLPNLFLVMGADKGMAGGYMHNIIEMLEKHANVEKDEVLVAGYIGRSKIRKLGYKMDESFQYRVMNPDIYRAREMAELVVEKHLSGQYHGIYLIYTEMLSSMRQDPHILPLLPLDLRPLVNETSQKYTGEQIDYIPSAVEVFDLLVPYYLKGILYGALVEAFASELQARMMAMDNANKTADETISRLSIDYNQARQGKITQELTEIVAGIPEQHI